MRVIAPKLSTFVFGMAIVLATVATALIPSVARADTSYTTCPSFSQFKSDVEAISGSSTITFLAPYCSISADDTINVQSDANVTIKGNGLTLAGGTPSAHGTFYLLGVGANASLSVDFATLAYGQYGIIGLQPAEVVLSNSTIQGMTDEGIVAGSPLTIKNSLLLENDNGGATSYQSIAVTNSTVTGNGQWGLFAVDQMSATSSTIVGNHTYGIVAPSISLTSSILAGNTGGNCYTDASDLGYNLSTDDTCGLSATSSRNNVDPSDLRLGTLANNGGPTRTISPMPRSIAIDAIPVSNGACLAGESTDQRQLRRTQQGKGCDIGAFEVMKSTPGMAVTLVNLYQTRVAGRVMTGFVPGRAPSGFLSWNSDAIGLTNVTILGLNANGPKATILGTAVLTDGTPVGFSLEAQVDYPQRLVRLSLSNGYDSGEQHADFVRVAPLFTVP